MPSYVSIRLLGGPACQALELQALVAELASLIFYEDRSCGAKLLSLAEGADALWLIYK